MSRPVSEKVLRQLLAAGAAVLGLGVVLTGMPAAQAFPATGDSETVMHATLARDGQGSSVGRIDVVDLLPGDEPGTAQLLVEQRLGEVADIQLVLDGVENLENGCVRPEQKAGDDCSSEHGELGSQLELSAARGVVQDGACVPPAGFDPRQDGGSVDELAEYAWVLGRLARDETACWVLAWYLPHRPDNNLVMSDQLRFDLTVSGRQVDPETTPPPGTDVLGERIERDGSGDRAGSGTAVLGQRHSGPAVLPRTGSELLALALAGAVVLFLGVSALAASWRRHKEVR